MDMKRLILWVSMSAALVLTGCSSDGNGPSPGDPMPTDPPTPIASATITAALANLLPSDMTIPHTSDPVTIPAGGSADIGPATFSCPAGGGACTVNAYTQPDGTFVVMQTGGVTVAASTAAVARKTAADAAAAIASVIALPKADDAAADDPPFRKITDVTGLPGSNEDKENTFAIGMDGKAMAGTVEVGGADFEMDDDAMPATLMGFSGSVYERMMTDDPMKTPDDMTDDVTTTDMLTLYTDKMAPGNSAWSDYYSDADAGKRDGVEGGAMGVLTLSTGGDTGGSMLFNSPWFPAPPMGQTGTRTTKENDGTTDVDESAFAGKFNGIDGMYHCETGTCEAAVDADGNFELDGAWRFTPTGDITQITLMGVVPDGDFLSFGYWVQTVDGADGMTKINAVYGGSMPFNDSGAIQDLKGTATYTGKATGQYVKKTGGMPTTSGQFTADAELMAQFGGDDMDIGTKFINSIQGTVDNFMGANGDDSISGWELMLGLTNYDINDGTFEGDTSTGMGSTAGGWEGRFYGPTVANDADTDVDERVTGYPTGVAGRFNGHFDDGHVIGSFGATR